jgi:MFS family permease
MQSKWLTLAACSWVFAHYHAARVMIQPILPILKEKASLDYTFLGILSSGYDFGYGLTLVLGGYLADRVNRKHLICAGLLWLSLWKALTALASSSAQLILMRALTGMGFGTYFGAGLSLIAESFPPNERGKAMGIHAVAAGVGRALAFPLIGLLAVRFGWQLPFSLFSLLVLFSTGLFAILGREPRQERGHRAEKRLAWKDLLDLIRSRSLLNIGIVYCLTIACAVGEGPFLILYLVDVHRLSPDYASGLAGLCQLTSIPFTLVASSLSDTYGRKRILSAILAMSFLSYILLLSVESGIGLVLLLIFGIGDIVAASMLLQTIMTEVAPPAVRGMALGYLNTWGVITGVLAAPALGLVSDLLGLRWVFILMAAIALICIPLTARLKIA